MVAFETVHAMKYKHSDNCGFMALKLDMSKAYDRVEWSYLKGVMKTMGFSDKWINLLMKCVGSVSNSVLVNGRACGLINPTRRVRQGDPISSYLFLLCTEGFHWRSWGS